MNDDQTKKLIVDIEALVFDCYEKDNSSITHLINAVEYIKCHLVLLQEQEKGNKKDEC